MSFADEVCAELYALPVKKPCCRRAFAGGLLLNARREAGNRVTLSCRRQEVAALFGEHLEKLFSKPVETKELAYHGHRAWTVEIISPAAAKLVTQLQSEGADLEALLKLSACESCRSAFLRALFFVCGTVNDPQKSSHMEFALESEQTAQNVAAYLDAVGYPPKQITRQQKRGLYYKDSTSVGDLLTMMGSHSIIFEFYNTRIERDIRNNENRATNCVARNIEKSIAAAARQMEAIGRLMESGKLEALPEPLRITALLRYRNPDATLDELKELHTPPISKSGLNHRLQKLMDAAEK